MCRAAPRSGAVATGGSGTRAVMEGRTARRVIKEVCCIKTGIAGQVSEVVCRRQVAIFLLGKVRQSCTPYGWGPLGCISVS